MVKRLVFLWLLLGSSLASSIPNWSIRLAQQQGPNVCIVEEVPKTKHKIWTECKYWKPRDICGQKPILRYECCEGYTRIPGTLGCTGVKPLRNVLQTAKDLGANSFVNYIEESGLSDQFTRDGAITLFAPSDQAMQELGPEKLLLLERYKTDRQNPIVMYHAVDRRISSPNFKADLLVDTKYPGHKIRINKFSSKIETVNCASIIRKDHEATNGIVHIIDSVLDPTISSPRNLADILVQDGRFNQLSRIMERSGISSSLRRSELPITIFAPSDEAFQKLPRSLTARILDDTFAREMFIKNHIVTHTLCGGAVLGESKLRAESGDLLTLNCTSPSSVSLASNKLTSDVTLGRNGILYMIDNVLLPNRVKSLHQLAEEEGLHSFVHLIKVANLENMFKDNGDYTVFAPSDKAMLSLLPERIRELRNNKEEAIKFVLHHAIEGKVHTDSMGNNEERMSLDEEYPLRFQVNRKSIGVDDSIIEKPDLEGINGILHVINKPLTPLTQSWREILQNNSTFSTFLQAYNQILSERPDTIAMAGYKTIFVPTNAAFQRVGEHLSRMETNPNYLSKVIKNHIADNMVTSSALSSGLQYFFETQGEDVAITKEKDKLKVNGASTVECDLMNKNGVVHIIDKVLIPENFNDVIFE